MCLVCCGFHLKQKIMTAKYLQVSNKRLTFVSYRIRGHRYNMWRDML